MTRNLTESMAHWPWAAWLILAGLAFTVELFRRDRWAENLIMGCVLAGAIAVVLPKTPALQFAGLVLGTLGWTLLTRPWRPDTGRPPLETGADAALHDH